MASIFRFFHTSAALYNANDVSGTFTVTPEFNVLYASFGGVVARIVSCFRLVHLSKADEAMLSMQEGRRICSTFIVTVLPPANALQGIV